jgi:ABC-type Na+ efflux pump permease subunit
MRSPLSNPLVKLEVTSRFRGARAAWGIPLALLLPALAVTVIYVGAQRNPSLGSADAMPEMVNVGGGQMVPAVMLDPGPSIDQLDSLGLGMFVAVVALLLLAIMVMVPALVGGSISGERANLTLQPLQLTRLTPADIVTGKLISSVAYLLLVVVCAAPVVSIPYLLGGVDASDIGAVALVFAAIAVELAAVSLMVSASFKRPAGGIVVSLLFTGLLVIGPFVVMAVLFYWQRVSGVRVLTFETSWVRYVAGASPVALFGWLGRIDQENATRWGRDLRFIAVGAWALVTTSSLLIARRRVTAPVDRDR